MKKKNNQKPVQLDGDIHKAYWKLKFKTNIDIRKMIMEDLRKALRRRGIKI